MINKLNVFKKVKQVKQKVKQIIPKPKKKRNYYKPKEVYSKLLERYKEKVKITFLKNRPTPEEIIKHINKNKFIVYLDKSKGAKNIFGESKYCKLVANLIGNQIYFAKIQNRGEKNNSSRNLYDIKLFNDFLIKYAKEQKIPEIRMNTWLFEAFPGFSEFLGNYKPVNFEEVSFYLKSLNKKGCKKVLYYDFKEFKLYGMDKLGTIRPFNVGLPEYVLKIK